MAKYIYFRSIEERSRWERHKSLWRRLLGLLLRLRTALTVERIRAELGD